VNKAVRKRNLFSFTSILVTLSMVLSPLGLGGNSLAYARDDHKKFETSLEDKIPAQSAAVVMGVTTFAPSANSHNNSQNTTISITYNEDIDPTTVTAQTFAIHAMKTGQLLQTFSTNGGQAVLTPSQSINLARLFKSVPRLGFTTRAVLDLKSQLFGSSGQQLPVAMAH